ncbi:MAG: hypothetical protein O7G87_11645 [bacterium]|nr:hypothetical protein [bacterium]
MYLRTVFFLLMGVLALFSGRASAIEYMSVDEIQRGMKGIGRTVFQGTRIDTFHVEILGVLRNVFGPKSDMILARLSGGPLAETGIIAGMSGSPVYIDGKLIGAVGWGWSFTQVPIAGITPIGEMMAMLDRKSEAPDTVSSFYRQKSFRTVQVPDLGMGVGELRPVAVPLMMSGFAPQVLAKYREDLLGLGLLPVQAGGGMDPSLPVGPFEPGASVGVQLLRGDFNLTTIGTLTHRIGDRILGFGHPNLWWGRTALPMTAAYIHEIVPNQINSFKLGVGSRPMGVIVQDRAPGIAGVVGTKAKMMPARIEVHSADQDVTFEMEVFRNRELTPLLMRMAVASSLISAEKLVGETTVRGRVRIKLKGYDLLEIEDVYAGPRGLGLAVLGLTQPFAQLMQNPFQEVQVEEVAFQLDVEDDVWAADIRGIQLKKSSFEAGDTVDVMVRLKPHMAKEETVEARLVIPDRFQKGRLMLRATNGKTHRAQEIKRAPGVYTPQDLDGLVRLLGKRVRNDDLVLELVASMPSVTVEDREMTALPVSVLSALKQSRASGVVQEVRQTVLDQDIHRTNYMLSGSQTVLLSVGDGTGLIFTGKASSQEKR